MSQKIIYDVHQPSQLAFKYFSNFSKLSRQIKIEFKTKRQKHFVLKIDPLIESEVGYFYRPLLLVVCGGYIALVENSQSYLFINKASYVHT